MNTNDIEKADELIEMLRPMLERVVQSVDECFEDIQTTFEGVMSRADREEETGENRGKIMNLMTHVVDHLDVARMLCEMLPQVYDRARLEGLSFSEAVAEMRRSVERWC